MSLFKSQLQQTDWTCIYDCDDVNYFYDILLRIISEAFEHCFPLTKLSRKRMKVVVVEYLYSASRSASKINHG